MRADSARLPLRFVAAGLWNSLAGWLIFSCVWLLAGQHWNLWSIFALSHLLATTQAFLVQRRFVFDAASGSLTAQFLRFQFAYLMVLALGAVFINALAVQGVHPLLAQLLGMALLALVGFFVARDFVFPHHAVDVRELGRRLRHRLIGHRLAIGLFLLCMALLEVTMGSKFYRSSTHVGHDFALSATALLEGKYWIDVNGLLRGLFDPPWFTPAWCAGSALLADPQAAFYSPLQALALVFDPFTATHLTMLLSVGLGFWGAYWLGRRVLGWDYAGASVFAALGAANTFVPLRAAVGEGGYLSLYLWPFLVLALVWPRPRNADGPIAAHGAAAIGVALVWTAWIQFGYGGMLVPTTLAALLLVLVLEVRGKGVGVPALVLRLTAGASLAAALNAVRLVENTQLLRNFPRDFYALPGFPSLIDTFVAIEFALFLPSQWTMHFASPRLRGVQFTVLPHEWALEFGLGALAMAAASGLWFALRRGAPAMQAGRAAFAWRSVSVSAWLCALLAAVLAAVPVLLLWNQGELRQLLKHVPILNSAAWPMRWIVIYLPAVQLLLAGVFYLAWRGAGGASNPRLRLLPWLAVVTIWAGPAMMPKDYYLDRQWQGYDPRPARQAFAESLRSPPPPITNVTLNVGEGAGARNDTMFRGASQGYCYNPIFGYRLEAMPQIERLVEAPALAVFDDTGRSIIRNPACLVHPLPNACKPGDGFLLSDPEQLDAAQRFIDRQPYPWRRSDLARAAAWMSQLTFWLLFVGLGLRGWLLLLRRLRGVEARR